MSNDRNADKTKPTEADPDAGYRRILGPRTPTAFEATFGSHTEGRLMTPCGHVKGPNGVLLLPHDINRCG